MIGLSGIGDVPTRGEHSPKTMSPRCSLRHRQYLPMRLRAVSHDAQGLRLPHFSITGTRQPNALRGAVRKPISHEFHINLTSDGSSSVVRFSTLAGWMESRRLEKFDAMASAF